MNVSFVFPDFSVREFERAVEIANDEISRRNRATSPARILFYAIYSALFAVAMYGVLQVWWLLIYLITARSEPVKVYGLMTGAGFSVGVILLLRKFIPYLIGRFFEFAGISVEETYTFGRYVERRDEAKRVEYRQKYLLACGVIENSKIMDVAVNCKGEECTVDVQFTGEYDDRPSNVRFNMPCRMVKSVDEGAVVDFRRECVLIMTEKGVMQT